MSDPKQRLVFLFVFAGCILSGCAANKPTPPLPPASSSVYEQKWAFVPVRPPELEADGRKLKPRDFHVETPHSVLVYRYEETVIGTSARIEGREVVVEKKDGTVARYPIHTVSRIKDTMQNQVLFPAPKVH